MKSEYEFTDVEQEKYANSQSGEDEPPDKVTKWLVIMITLAALVVIIVQLKYNIGR